MDTYGFPWAEEHVCDDLSAGRGDEEADSLVLSGLFSENALIDILEHFVESKLSEALETVADERGEPSLYQTNNSVSESIFSDM